MHNESLQALFAATFVLFFLFNSSLQLFFSSTFSVCSSLLVCTALVSSPKNRCVCVFCSCLVVTWTPPMLHFTTPPISIQIFITSRLRHDSCCHDRIICDLTAPSLWSCRWGQLFELAGKSTRDCERWLFFWGSPRKTVMAVCVLLPGVFLSFSLMVFVSALSSYRFEFSPFLLVNTIMMLHLCSG